MTRKEICAWMDKQIKAEKIRQTPLYEDDPFRICIAGPLDKEIHIYQIDNLCEELDISYEVEEHSEDYDRHYFMYKDYKFFGLVSKEEETHEGK